MLFKNTIKIALTSLVLSQVVYAAENTPIKLALINNTDQTGTAFVYISESIIKGPDVEKNGGHAPMIYQATDQEPFVGLWIGSLGQFCLMNGGNLQLDVKAYQGDTITISYNKLKPPKSGGVECTCTGSACSVATQQVKKYIS